MRCSNCGFEFEDGFFCPQCGNSLDSKNVSESEKVINEGNHEKTKKQEIYPGDTIATISLVLSIITVLGLPTGVISLIAMIPAMVLGISALARKTRRKKSAAVGILLPLIIIILIVLVTVDEIKNPSSSETSSYSVNVDNNSDYVEKDASDVRNEEEEEIVEVQEEINDDSQEKNEQQGEMIANAMGSIPDIYEVQIYIDYEKRKHAHNDEMIIYIDGEEMGKVKAGDSVQFTLYINGGEHDIWAESDTLIRNNNTPKIKFNVGYDELSYKVFLLAEEAHNITISETE